MKRQTLVALVLVTILLASLVGFAVAQGPDRRGGHKLPVASETPATEEPAEAEVEDAWESDLGVVEGPGLRAGDYSFVGGGRKNKADGDYSSVVGGYNSWAKSKYATIGGGQHNTAIGWRSTIAGGRDNETQAQYATVGGGRENKATQGYSTVGGGKSNTASGYKATVGGGNSNTATGNYSTVGGGNSNTASGIRATVGGGILNTASYDSASVGGGGWNTASGYNATVGGGEGNTASDTFTTVGGGWFNTASDWSATVGGGEDNTASGEDSTVGGGSWNTASGNYATVPGGRHNTAGGKYSFAAGYRAKANHEGSLVLADYTLGTDFSSQREDQFRVRANGGARFDVNDSEWVDIRSSGGKVIDTSTGAYLSSGGTWTNSSDRQAKENIEVVDEAQVLAKLAEVPISTWNYIAQDATVQHMGPMAQDFHAAFGLGEDDRHIAALDLGGANTAAIQALYELVQQQADEIEGLKARLAELERAARG